MNQCKEFERKIDFQFTAVPSKLMTALDVNCSRMLFVLCQLADQFADEQGVFFRTNADLVEQSGLSEKLVRATLDTLYSKGVVQIWSVGKGKGKHSNKFRLNLEKFREFEGYTFDELKNPELKITTVEGYNKKGYSPSYLKEVPKQTPHQNPTEIPQVPQSTNNIEYIDTTENKDIINNKVIEYSSRIYNMLEQGMSLEDVAKCLAPTDWNCFVYFRNMLKENEETRHDYFKMNGLFSNLNYNFNPN